MSECPCVIPDETMEHCLDCGRRMEVVPEVEPPNLGDIAGIARLISATAKTYAQLVKDNTDPKNPDLPRLRMVGGKMLRIPHKSLCKETLAPSYATAKALGYRGSLERWGEMVWEAVPISVSL